MAAEAGIDVSRDDGVVTVTIDRPDRMNAIDSAAERRLQFGSNYGHANHQRFPHRPALGVRLACR